MTEIILDAKICLQQAVDLLAKLEESDYSLTLDAFSSHSIGAHVRHNLDHFNSFFMGYNKGSINYDERARDPKIETDKEYTSDLISNYIIRISEIKPETLDHEISIQMDSGDVSDKAKSTIRRELQFLISHTIHHYAIIALICKIKNIEVPQDFGVAPSTLKHREQSLQACAH